MLELHRGIIAAVSEDRAEQTRDGYAVLERPPIAEELPGTQHARTLIVRQPVEGCVVVQAGPQTTPGKCRPLFITRGSKTKHEDGLIAQTAERRTQRAGQRHFILRVFESAEQVQ